MNSKQRDSGGIARRVFCLGSARLRSLLLMPVIIAWALLAVVPGPFQPAQAQVGKAKKTVPYGALW